MSKTVVTIKIPATPAYSAGWMLDALANGAHKGLISAKKGVSKFQAEGLTIIEGKSADHPDPDSEQAQARLADLDTWIDEREEQIVDFESVRDTAAAEFHGVSGKVWQPYVAKDTKAKSRRSKTAVNKSWAKRAKAATG